MLDAGIPMLTASAFSMPMPSYAKQYAHTLVFTTVNANLGFREKKTHPGEYKRTQYGW
jgi:hypothetical protein